MKSIIGKLTFTALGGVLLLHGSPAMAQVPGLAPSGPAPAITETVVTESVEFIDLGVHPTDVPQLRHSQILGLPFSDCSHVIDLLLSNQMRRQFGPPETQLTVHLPWTAVGLAPGDLELLCVKQISDGCDAAGPMFQLTLRNCSPLAVGSFQISLVGLLGQITVDSPSTTVCVNGLAAGVTAVIQIQLPATCLTMGLPGQPPAAFDTLVVAIDSFDELLESDELNNVQILNRSEIPLLVPATEASAPVDSDIAAPAPDVTTPIPAPPSTIPHDPAPSSPLDGLDLDDPGLDDANAQAFFVR